MVWRNPSWSLGTHHYLSDTYTTDTSEYPCLNRGLFPRTELGATEGTTLSCHEAPKNDRLVIVISRLSLRRSCSEERVGTPTYNTRAYYRKARSQRRTGTSKTLCCLGALPASCLFRTDHTRACSSVVAVAKRDSQTSRCYVLMVVYIDLHGL